MLANNKELAEMERKLRLMAEVIEDDDVTCELFEANEQFALPTLVTEFPDDEEGRSRYLLLNFVPLPEGSEYTDFTQFYVELPFDLTKDDPATLRGKIDQLNRVLPLGHCMTLKDRPDLPYRQMAGLRYMYPMPKGQDFNENTFLETLMVFLVSYDAAERFFLEGTLE